MDVSNTKVGANPTKLTGITVNQNEYKYYIKKHCFKLQYYYTTVVPKP